MRQKNVLILTRPVSHIRLGGIARFAKRHAWHLVIADRLARLPVGWTGDGALVSARGDKTVLDFIRGLVRKGIPVVDLTIDHPEIRVPRVSGDHAACGRLAAEHLAARHFVHAAWFSTIWSHSHALRFEGFTESWQTRTGRPVTRWVLSETLSAREFDNWRTFTNHLVNLIRKAPKPLAILGYDDADAARVLTACLEADIRVPEDVAVIGIGNDAIICENQASELSSVRHNLARIGYAGAALLDRLMTGRRPVPDTVWIPPTGVVSRASTDIIAAEHPLVRAALDMMRAHLADALRSDEIAARLGISRTRLDRLFAQTLRSSVQRETMRLRIREASFLLKDPSFPVKAIAATTGFATPSHLSNAFKAATGLTPGQFRRQG